MAITEGEAMTFEEDDHQAAYIFNPREDAEHGSRPPKRRRVSGTVELAGSGTGGVSPGFEPLLKGAERAECVRRRKELFESSWACIEDRIQRVLREANQSTLEEVSAFVRETVDQTEKIPTAFIVAGPNVASQNLLFEQLSETLHDVCQGRFVRIRSVEAPNLKGTLKKIIRDATRRTSVEDDDAEVMVGQDGRKFLDYDLEALHAFVRPSPSRRVIVTFEDSEAFDSGLLSDLITLFNSWRGRIQWTLLFGVATSVELFQARLLKSTCRHLYGGQFDVVQTAAILDSIIKRAVAAVDTSLSVGPCLLRALVERQSDQVAGLPVFVSSLKYAYMCHFYANPLGVFTTEEAPVCRDSIQPEHLEAVRSLPSFRQRVEALVDARDTKTARLLLEDDDYLAEQIQGSVQHRQAWLTKVARCLHLLYAASIWTEGFAQHYIGALSDGIDLSAEGSILADPVRRMGPDEILALIQQVLDGYRNGDADLALGAEDKESALGRSLHDIEHAVKALQDKAGASGAQLRSKYSAQSKVLRTTVIAQKVQLSRDTSALTEEDKEFTALVDRLTDCLSKELSCEGADSVFLHELWLYDSNLPHRDVFVPRPGSVFQRALTRPHDYLACSCCADKGQVLAATEPATAVLYRLYLETGSLVNVADLWTAFYGVVGKGDADEEEESAEKDDGGEDERYDERTALVLFYRALAELKAMGYVKASRKKADHVAKLKWL